MSIFPKTEASIEYRVLPLVSGREGVVLERQGDGSHRALMLTLPCLVRLCPQLHTALRSTWRLYGSLLEIIPGRDSGPTCLVVELFSDVLPTSLEVVSISGTSAHELTHRERDALHRLTTDESDCRLTRLGWLDEGIAWVESETRERITSKLAIKQYNGGLGFALYEFPMQDGRCIWLKAVGELQRHELKLTVLLSRLCSNAVPKIIAVKPEWNAWLSEGVAPFDESPEKNQITTTKRLAMAVETMAVLQISTVGRTKDLEMAGAVDQRLSVLRKRSDVLFERIHEAMALQTSTSARRLQWHEIKHLHTAFNQTCDLLLGTEMPETILHGDMNRGNVVYGQDCCQIIDWCEGYIGFPFATLQHLLLLNETKNEQARIRQNVQLTAHYCSHMREICSAKGIERAVVCMPLLAAASAMYGRGKWLDAPLQETTPQRAVHVRMLARYMYEAARREDVIGLISAPQWAGVSQIQNKKVADAAFRA